LIYGKGNVKPCKNPKCGHNTGDHQSKVDWEDGKVQRRWRGECEFNFCPCKKYEEPEKK